MPARPAAWTGPPADLLRDKAAAVHAFLLAQVADFQDNTAAVKGYEKVRAIAVVAAPFSVDNELLTPKLSMKRPAIVKVYQETLDALYTTPAAATP
jgi:long-chain acyl-CoA synthetase